jgi:hypothetical protein
MEGVRWVIWDLIADAGYFVELSGAPGIFFLGS